MHIVKPNRLRLALAIAVLVAVALLPSGPKAAESKPLFQKIGTLERFGDDARAALGSGLVPRAGEGAPDQRDFGGTVIVVPQARQLWQVYFPGSQVETGVVVRDLDTFRIVRTLRLEGIGRAAAIGDSAGGGDWAHAVDDTGTRLWLLERDREAVLEIDLRTFAVTRRPLPADAHPAPGSFQVIVGGLTYDSYNDDLLVLYGGPAPSLVANFNTALYTLDVSVPPPAAYEPADSGRLYRLRSCTAPVASTDLGGDTTNWDILVTEEHLYVPCQRLGHTVVIVRMPRPSEDPARNAQLPEDVTAGPVFGTSVLADQRSGRLFVTTFDREIWVFDIETMSFVGVVATNPSDNEGAKTGVGLDGDTGRVFFQSGTFGLGIVEGRFFPIPQARTFPRYVTGQHRIWSDARTRRVFVLEGDNVVDPAPAYTIYRTEPAPTPPSAPDPDRNTADVPQIEGVTEVRWNATASGYGSRVILANGLAAVLPAPGLGASNPVAQQFRNANRKCSFTDRELVLGRVVRSEYDTGSTAAQAVAGDVDNATRQDFNQASRCDLGNGSTNRTVWTVEPAICSAGNGFREGREASGEPRLGRAHARCPDPGGILEAEADARLTNGVPALPLDGVVDVARSWTKTTIRRLDEGDVRATVESVAQGVGLGDTLYIGEIRSRATSTANGRPKRKAMSTHDIEIRHVRFGELVLCEVRCDPVALERDLNTLAAGRAVFRTGLGPNSGRDHDLVQGSPRGAQTAVQKSVARQTSDRALVGDFTVEVPAFEMTVFNDNNHWGRARQVYQFAGVASSATCNIVVPPAAVPFQELGGLPEDPVTATAAVSDTPFAGLAKSLGGVIDGGALTDATVPAVAADSRGGAVMAAVRAVARGLRLVLTTPRTALALLTAWALLALPVVLARRRRLLGGAKTP